MGKVIGGGLPVGAYGGRKDIMEMVAPAGPDVPSGHPQRKPLGHDCGHQDPGAAQAPWHYEKLEATTKRLAEGIQEAAKAAGLPVCGNSISAMFGFFLCDGPVRNFEEAKANDSERFAKLHRAMLERGVYLAPSSFEAGFTSLAHSDADIDATLEAFRETFQLIA